MGDLAISAAISLVTGIMATLLAPRVGGIIGSLYSRAVGAFNSQRAARGLAFIVLTLAVTPIAFGLISLGRYLADSNGESHAISAQATANALATSEAALSGTVSAQANLLTAMGATATTTQIEASEPHATLTALTAIQRDDFDDGRIDESRWKLQARTDQIYERDGNLILMATTEQTRAEDGASGELLAIIPEGQRVAQITFPITLASAEEGISAGAGIDLFLDDGQLFSLKVGPGEDGAGFDVSMCSTALTPFGECDNDGWLVAIGETLHVQIIITEQAIELRAGDRPPIRHAHRSGLKGWRFSFYAFEEAGFQALVDNVVVSYHSTAATPVS